jgi:NADH-quinone oxidoreductase subunit F
MVISACQHACPAGIDVPNYVAAVAAGNYQKAVDIIRERNPFAAVCGRICIHPCEYKCRRGELDDPVAIRLLKRFAADWYFDNIGRAEAPFPVTQPQSVAVVGAGMAGLSCAYFLAKMGYRTTVFEAQPEGGGMPAITVPEFRLPREVIQQEIDYIASCGVDILYNSPIDANRTVHHLLKNGYGAVFIAAGAQASKRIGIPGENENPSGLHYGLQFLADVKKAGGVSVGGRVVVIGGGNVAVDVARTALRVGARDVQLFCLESRDEMPAWEKEVQEAAEEGITFNPSWGPKQVLHHDGRVTGVEFVRCAAVFDDEGRFNPRFDEQTTQVVAADAVIISIGQAVDLSFLSEDVQLERALWGTLAVDDNTLATNMPGVFAGGDFITGPTFAIRAIASGRRGAIAIDRYLRGIAGPVAIPDEKSALHEDIGLALDLEGDQETSGDKPRVAVAVAQPAERIRDFREIECNFTEEQARMEATRCLRCDLENERRES